MPFCLDFFDDLFEEEDDLDYIIENIGKFPGSIRNISPIRFFKIIMICFFIIMFLQISQEIYLLYDCYYNNDCFMKQKNNFL